MLPRPRCRHDNDKQDFREIALAPTQAEALCIMRSFRPRNQPGSTPHQPAGSAEAHLELHFRHDQICWH